MATEYLCPMIFLFFIALAQHEWLVNTEIDTTEILWSSNISAAFPRMSQLKWDMVGNSVLYIINS